MTDSKEEQIEDLEQDIRVRESALSYIRPRIKKLESELSVLIRDEECAVQDIVALQIKINKLTKKE